MVTFLSLSPELSKRKYTSHVFKLCCLCLGDVVPELPNVLLGSPNRSVMGVDLADVIELLQSFLSNSCSEQKVFSSAESISLYLDILAEFEDKALHCSYNLWSGVDFHGRAKFHADLTKAYKDVRIAANVETDFDLTLSSGSPEKRLPQRKHPAQIPRIDFGKTSKAVAANTCASKLKLRSSFPGASDDCS